MSNQQIVPLDYITVKVENWDDIPKAVNCSNEIKRIVESNNLGFVTIDVSDAMTKLANVGDLLKIAYAASRGFPCSVPIISILSDYQSLVNDTVYTTSQFVYYSISALAQHSLALRVAEKYPLKAVELLCKSSDKAQEMIDICQKLVDMADSLVMKSTEALELANKDNVTFTQKEKENRDAQNELNAKKAKLESEAKDLRSSIEEFKQLAEKESKEASNKRLLGSIFQGIGAIAQIGGPVASVIGFGLIKIGESIQSSGNQSGNGGGKDPILNVKEVKTQIKTQIEIQNKELEKKQEELKKLEQDEQGTSEKKQLLVKEIDRIKTLIKQLDDSLSKVMNEISKQYKELAAKSENKEAEYRRLKCQYQDLERKSNAKLAESLSKLKSYSAEQNYLEVSLKSLEITISTMGKVKTIFENTKLFWNQIKTECKKLADSSQLKELSQLSDLDKDFQIDYMNQIKKSGLNWLSLSKINYDAANTIVGVKKNFDTVMSNLPGKEEALKIVNECTTAMEKLLIEDNNKIAKYQQQLQLESAQPISA